LARWAIREWDAISLTGARATAAVALVVTPGVPPGTILLDDVTFVQRRPAGELHGDRGRP